MSGGKGGSTTSKVEIPAWLEQAAQENLARGQAVANIGYTPYYGPDVAAMTPMQMASMQGTSSAAGAFGLPGGGMTGMEGMPTPQTFAGGVQGYSSGGLYDQALAELQTRRPGQYNAITGMFVDPITGAQPINTFEPITTLPVLPTPTIPPANSQRDDRGRDGDRGTSGGNRSSGGGTGSFGLPDPMSGRISSVGPIGRDGGGGMGRGK
jgi:hypothetical protein